MQCSATTCLLSLVVSALLALPTSAQRTTWIVDAAGGPGSQFTEIQPAVDAAQAGDRILVRPGSYQRFRVSKGVAIDGPGARVSGFFFGVEAARLPAGQRLTLRGLVSEGVGVVAVLDCAGVVVLQDVEARKVTIERSRSVMLVGARVGQPSGTGFGLVARDSTVSIDGGRISGSAGPAVRASDGVLLEASRLVASRAWIQGGADGFGGRPAIQHDAASSVLVTGDGSGRIASGRTGVPAISGSGTLILSPAVQVVGGVSPPGSATRLLVPSLVAAQAGSNRTLDLFGSPLTPYATLLGLPSATPSQLPGVVGDVWLDPNGPLVVFDAGGLPASGRLVTTLMLPASPSLLGLPFTWQSVTADVSGTLVSNPGTYVLVP